MRGDARKRAAEAAPSPAPAVTLTEAEHHDLIRAFFEPDDDCAHNMMPAYATVERIIAARTAEATARAEKAEQERDEWKRRRDLAVETCRFRHQEGLTAEEWHTRICGAVEGAQQERAKRQKAEAALARVRTLVDECGSSSCIHLNDMYGRLRAALDGADQ